MADKMIQQVMTNPGEIIFRNIDKPEPKAGEILVRVRRIGICGSDIHVYHGTHPFTSYPITQAHEVSGEIAALGEGVDGKFQVGQAVTFEPQVFCGKCYPCTHGKYNLCENLKVMGFQTTGAASEYFAVDQSKVDILPNGISMDEGAMIEPLAVAVHAAKRCDMKDATVVILGAGPIGILVCQACKAAGAKKVMMTDISDYRLELARSVGADQVVNTTKVDFNDALIDFFGSDKCDYYYDCAGSDITMNQAIRSARKGAKLVLVAVFNKLANVDLAVLNDHELDLDTTMMYRHEDYVDAIKWVHEGKIKLTPLISKHFAFRDYLSAYEYIDANRETTMKILIDV